MTSYEETTLHTLNTHLQKLYASLPTNYTFTDVLINPNGSTFAETNNGKVLSLGKTLSGIEIIRIGVLLASITGTSLSENSPRVSASIDGGKKRFEILIPPSVEEPSLSLRIHSKKLFTIEDLHKMQMITEEQINTLTKAIKNRKNIVISGETGSGKTTLLSALVNTIDKNERLVIIEDGCSEINCSLTNVVKITATDNTITGRSAVQSSLRMNPDRIIYGEIRNGETALETLKAWRTGHNGGLTTIHATSAKSIYSRFEDLISEETQNSKYEMISQTIDIRVHCAIKNGKRYVEEILE